MLAARRFDAVLSSSLTRASETCRLAGLGDAARTEPVLLEWDDGAYEGLTTQQIRAQVCARVGRPGSARR